MRYNLNIRALVFALILPCLFIPTFRALGGVLTKPDCKATLSELGFDLAEFQKKAEQTVASLNFKEPPQVTYVHHGGDKVVFKITPSSGQKSFGLGISRRTEVARVKWESVVTNSQITHTPSGIEIISPRKGVRGYALTPDEKSILWEWSETTLKDSLAEFHAMSEKDPARFLEIFEELADSLDLLSNPPNKSNPSILHRDIKVDNIHVVRLPGGQVELKLSDFGIAAVKDPGTTEWKLAEGTDTAAGTPLYLSQGRLHAVSPEDDTHPFGMMLAELLAGKRVDALEPGQTYITGFYLNRIPKLRLPVSEINPKAPKDLALIADYSTYLARDMRDVRELMGDALKMRVDEKEETPHARFSQQFFKNYLVPQLKKADPATCFFVFRSKEMIDEFIGSSDLTKLEKEKVIQFIDAQIEKKRLDVEKVTNVYIIHNNPYYNAEGLAKAKKEVKKKGFWSLFRRSA